MVRHTRELQINCITAKTKHMTDKAKTLLQYVYYDICNHIFLCISFICYVEFEMYRGWQMIT